MAESGTCSQDGRADRVARIVVAGGGLAAWLAATSLARVLGRGRCEIKVVAAGDGEETLAPFGPADATVPPPARQHPAMDLDEGRMLRGAAGAFTLGIALEGWNGVGATYFHPFSSLGAPLGPVSFHQVALRLRGAGVALRLSNFALAALAAQAGRFLRPGADPASVLSTCRYGLHVDGAGLAALYRDEALELGVSEVRQVLDEVEIEESGALYALRTRDGTRHGADLFLDCTGPEARLISSMPGSDWLGWGAFLPCDRALSARVKTGTEPLPFSQAHAHSAGWVRSVPLGRTTALTQIYSSERLEEGVAVDGLRALAGRKRLQDLHARYLRFGRWREPWRRNCLALGTAAGLIDPVGVSNLQLLRTGLHCLLELLPGSRCEGVEAAEYNRRFGACLDHARDFAAAHYRLNGRYGEAFWDACREAPVSPELDYKLRLYASRGRIALYDDEPLGEESWINLLDEHGLEPRSYTPIADSFTIGQLRGHAQRVRAHMLEAVRHMPVHARYLARLSAAGRRKTGIGGTGT